MIASSDTEDLKHLRHAARLAIRGHGGAEPNPMVGCVLVDSDGRVVGEGFHQRCGGPHAEINALSQAGSQARGATAYVTLEPCNHTGRTGPCSQALIDARVGRVVIGCPEPNAEAVGGAERLMASGIQVDQLDDPLVRSVAAPFARVFSRGLPWVTAKWAQTVDGRIATRSGVSQWISSPRSRGLVHRQRGRVDVILTGIGTVLADDPQLTARNVRRRRVARRVVVDPTLQIPLESSLVTTAADVPTTVATLESTSKDKLELTRTLERAGVEVLAIASETGDVPLETLLRELVSRHQSTTVMVEAGGGLLGRLFRANLVNEAWVFIAPLLLGDDEAIAPLRGGVAHALTEGVPLRLVNHYIRGGDLVARYLVDTPV